MKSKFYLATAIVALLWIGCSQEEVVNETKGGAKTIYATIEGSSRSAVTDAGVFSWTSGDLISLLDANNKDIYTYSGTGNGFDSPTPTTVTTPIVAYYPANDSHTTTQFYLPASYGNVTTDYVASTHAAMIATPPAEGNTFAFMHLGGVMRFNVKNVPAQAKSFSFTATGKKIAGSFDINNGIIETSESQSGGNTVTINFKPLDAAKDMTFYVPLPVGEYGDYTVSFGFDDPTNEIKNESTNVTNTIARKTLLLMPTFSFEENGSKLIKGKAKVGVIDLEDGSQSANIASDAEVVVTPGTDADAVATLNYTPANDNSSVLSLSDGSGEIESGVSEGKVVVSTAAGLTVASCDINTPSLTVELSAAGEGTATFTEVTALTANQTLIIGKGVTVTTLNVKGGNVIIEEGATVTTINNNATDNTITRQVKTSGGLTSAIESVLGGNSAIIEVVEDITDLDADNTITIPNGKTLVLDLKDYTVAGISDQTGSNRNMFDVRGNLTVKNGTMTIKHTGTNMAWNNSTNVFNVTAGGVLNIEKATIENLGGSDMAFCVHLNNWGEVTLNAEDVTFKSTYVGIRAFNSGYDMNNITLTDCNILTVSSCIWVHNYTVADFSNDNDKATAAAQRLNFNFTNTEIARTNGSKSLVRFGFTDAIYYSNIEMTEVVAGTEAALAWAFTHGKDVIINNNITLTSGVTVPTDAEITLDLNGCTIGQEIECTNSYSMITNKGNLEIKGKGTISFEDLGAGPTDSSWGTYTIRNEGKLVVSLDETEGYLVNKGPKNFSGTGDPIAYVIDNHNSGEVTINSGNISSPKSRSLRNFYTDGKILINGGVFEGQIWIQQGNASGSGDYTTKIASLTINNGNFSPAGNDGSSVFLTNHGADNVKLSITGGVFNTKVGCSDATQAGVKGSITGGEFTESAKANTNSALLADGYEFKQEGTNNYVVSKKTE